MRRQPYEVFYKYVAYQLNSDGSLNKRVSAIGGGIAAVDVSDWVTAMGELRQELHDNIIKLEGKFEVYITSFTPLPRLDV